MKATASHRAEKQPRTTDQELPLTGQCAREPACYVRSRRSPGASKIKQTAQSKLAYFYAALMDQFCAALDSPRQGKDQNGANLHDWQHFSGNRIEDGAANSGDSCINFSKKIFDYRHALFSPTIRAVKRFILAFNRAAKFVTFLLHHCNRAFGNVADSDAKTLFQKIVKAC